METSIECIVLVGQRAISGDHEVGEKGNLASIIRNSKCRHLCCLRTDIQWFLSYTRNNNNNNNNNNNKGNESVWWDFRPGSFLGVRVC